MTRPKHGASCSTRTRRPWPTASTPHAGQPWLQLAGLDGEHQPLPVVDLDVEDVHAGNIEDRIGPGAPARTRATHKVRHRRGLRIGCLVATDPEGPDILTP